VRLGTFVMLPLSARRFIVLGMETAQFATEPFAKEMHAMLMHAREEIHRYRHIEGLLLINRDRMEWANKLEWEICELLGKIADSWWKTHAPEGA
jgi:hypothetical protein